MQLTDSRDYCPDLTQDSSLSQVSTGLLQETARKKSKPETGLDSRGPLKALIDTKLILNLNMSYSFNQLGLPIRAFRGSLLPKPVSWFGLFFTISYSKPALVSQYYRKIGPSCSWIQTEMGFGIAQSDHTTRSSTVINSGLGTMENLWILSIFSKIICHQRFNNFSNPFNKKIKSHHF